MKPTETRRESDFASAHPVWAAINDLAVKVIPPLMVACILVVMGGAIATYTNVNRLTDKVQDHDSDIVWLRTEIGVLRSEMNEQKFELALLRVGINAPGKPLRPREGSK